MFCSNCGKTLKPGDSHCPHCGAAVGNGPFSAISYTTSLPDGDMGTDDFAFESVVHEEESYAPYTRTSYTSMEEGDGDIFSRTTYRPVLDAQQESEARADDSSDESTSIDSDEVKATDEPQTQQDDVAEKAAKEAVGEDDQEGMQDDSEIELTDVDESIPDESIEIPPLQPISRPGISDEVKSYMEQAKDQRKQTVAAHSKKDFSLAGIFGKKQADEPGEADAKADEEFESLDGFAEDISSGEAGAAPLNLSAEGQAKAKGKLVLGRFNLKKILGAAFAAVVIVVLLVVGIRWMVNLFTPVAKIPDVSVELYDKGTTLIKTRITDEYRSEIVKLYIDDPSTASLVDRQEKDLQAFDALLPEESKQKADDKRFVSALKKIQEAINNATSKDALVSVAADEATKTTLAAAADKEWGQIQNLIKRLESATSRAELVGLSETADEVLATPEPSPEPTPSPYSVLKNGMRGSEEIEALQQRLTDLGYFSSEVDGDFGTKTVRAVKAFQRAVGMDDDGIASVEMQEKLFAADAPVATPKPDETPTAAADEGESA